MPMLLPIISFTLYAAAAYVATNWVAFTLIISAYAGMKSMSKAKSLNNMDSVANGRMQMTRESVSSRRVVYGRLKLAGPITYMSTISNVGSTKNENLHLIMALAGHECGGIDAIYANDVVVMSGSYNNPTFSGKFDYEFKTGSLVQTSFVIPNDTEWAAENPPGQVSMAGISAIRCSLVADQTVYPSGIPNITAVTRGKPVLNMNNVTVMPACDNPALILRDYLLNYFGATADEIDSTSFTSARDVCDEIPSGYTEKRYRCNYSFTLDTKPSSIIQDILNTMYGKLIYTNGKFILKVGAYSPPVYTLSDDDLMGGVTVTTAASLASSFNAVQGKYVDGENITSSFGVADFVPVTSSFYLNRDQGNYSVSDISLVGVTSHTQARRIAKLTLLDARQDLVASFPAKISGLRLVPGDTVYVTLARYGWSEKVFEVMELSVNADLSTTLTLKETASEIYDFPVDEDVDRDLSPNSNLGSAFYVSPPVNFAVSESVFRDTDGTIFPSVTATWQPATSGSIADLELSYFDTLGTNYEVLGKFGNTIGAFTTLDVGTGHTYNFRARNFNYLGTPSAYVSASITISGNTNRPSVPTSMTVTGGTASLSAKWSNPAVDTDYASTEVWSHTSNASASATLEGKVNGTMWNKTVTTSSNYYVWLKNVNTTGLKSDVAYAGTAFVYSIGTGADGPPGPSGSINLSVYKRSTLVPATPSGNAPPFGWSLTIPADNGDALWVSSAFVAADGVTLQGTWSVPKRLSGIVSYYQAAAPQDGVDATLAMGDVWFDTDDKYRVYRWNSSTWLDVQDRTIPQITASLNITTASLDTTIFQLGNLTASFNTLATQSYAISSSYLSSSASFDSSINNIELTYATNTYALALSTQSLQASVTSSNSYTNGQISSLSGVYATPESVLVVATSSMYASYNSASSYTNGQISSLSSVYTTPTYVQAATTSSTNAAVSTANSYTNGQISSLSSVYATPTYVGATATSTVNATISQSLQPGGIASASSAAQVAVVQSAVTTLDGEVAAEYVVNTTTTGPNGVRRIAGFRISNTGGSGGASDFIVQADKFAILNNSNGTVTQSFLADANGVYIDEATIRTLNAGKITAGTLTAQAVGANELIANTANISSSLIITAHIRDLAVETLKIDDNAVTIPISAASTGATSVGVNSTVTILTCASMVVATGQPVFLSASTQCTPVDNDTFYLRFVRDSTIIGEWQIKMPVIGKNIVTITYVDTPASGTYDYLFSVYGVSGNTGAGSFAKNSMLALLTKK